MMNGIISGFALLNEIKDSDRNLIHRYIVLNKFEAQERTR
jgi:hypothetical protein